MKLAYLPHKIFPKGNRRAAEDSYRSFVSLVAAASGGRNEQIGTSKTGRTVMLRLSKIRGVVLSCVLALGVIGGFGAVTNSAQADHCPTYTYKWVVTYEARLQPYQACVTKYDHCGKPYHVYVTRYRVLQVPVKKLVRVY
jgi:hypothetical protein